MWRIIVIFHTAAEYTSPDTCLQMLYICEYSLHFFKRKSQLVRHLSKCRVKHPPGEEIYRKGSVCMFEVDGHKEKTYSQVWL